VTWCSSIASSSADWVLGVARNPVGANQLGKNRPGVKLETGILALIYRHPDDVRGQHVARELYPVEVEPEKLRQHVRERGFADARQVLDEKMAAREQAGERESDLALLAEDYFPRLLDHALDQRKRHPGACDGVQGRKFTGKPL